MRPVLSIAIAGSQPMKYLLRYPASIESKVKQSDNTASCYGDVVGSNCVGVQLRAP